MLPSMRETTAIDPVVDALPAGAISNPRQLDPSSYQSSMLPGIRDTAAIDPAVDALPAGRSRLVL
jgi:hypothetical protein